MFETLSTGFETAIKHFRGRTVITPESLSPALKVIQQSLLEADVEYEVAQRFLEQVQTRALGAHIKLKNKARLNRTGKAQNVREYFTTICYEEICKVLGEKPYELKLDVSPSAIMMVGLQGVGKTTTCGKLARHLISLKLKPMLVACDVYRPAAIEQLQVLGQDLDIPVHSIADATPLEICKQARDVAQKQGCEVMIIDTAGRLTLDEEMMQEIKDLTAYVKPQHTFLVLDAMMGQDAVQTAQRFQEAAVMDAMIMTKLDGDARGGAALSASQVTGKPIAFVGVGEHLTDFELFRPEGLSSRILGMGDLTGLIAEFEGHDSEENESLKERMINRELSFEDMLNQINLIKRLGSFRKIISKLPSQMAQTLTQHPESQIKLTQAILLSMTRAERQGKVEIDSSRTRRIASGSGTSVNVVQNLIYRIQYSQQYIYESVSQSGGDLSQINPMQLLSGASGGSVPGATSPLTEREKMSLKQKRQKRKQVRDRRKASKRSRKNR